MSGARAILGLATVALLAIAPRPALAEDGKTQAPAATGVLLLAGSRLYEGEWHPGGDPGEILWRPGFLGGPVPFPSALARSIVLDDVQGPVPTATCVVHLVGDGGSLAADVIALDGSTLLVRSPFIDGPLALPRASVRRIEWQKSFPGFLGPGLPSEWQVVSPGQSIDVWRANERGLSTVRPGAELWKDLGLGMPSRIVLTVLSAGDPKGWCVRIGVPGHPALYADGLAVERWGDRVVAYRELEETLELVELGPARDTFDLVVEWDPSRRTAQFFDGEALLAILTIGEEAGSGIAIQNHGESFSIPRIEVLRRRLAGEVTLGAVGELDGGRVAAIAEGVVRFADGTSMPVAEVAGITFPFTGAASGAGESAAESADTADEAGTPAGEVGGAIATPATLRFRDNGSLAVRYLGAGAGRISVAIDGVAGAVDVPLREVREIEFHGHAPERPQKSPHRLAASGEVLIGTCHGFDAALGRLLWRPDGSTAAAPLAADYEGSVRFARESEYFVGRTLAPHDLHLADGDRMATRILAIEGEELLLASPFGGEFRIPTDEVRVVVLDSRALSRVLPDPPSAERKPEPPRRGVIVQWHGGASAPPRDRDRIDEERRRRALSLPRQSGASPPTHLLIGRNGDLLRGRLVAVGDSEVRFEVRLAELRIPIVNVVAVVRLDPPGTAAAGPADPGSTGTEPFAGPDELPPVQLVLADRMRIAARIESWDEERIVALTRWIGRVEVPIADLEQVLVGESLRSRLDPRFEKWVLEVLPAPAPPPEPAPVPPAGG